MPVSPAPAQVEFRAPKRAVISVYAPSAWDDCIGGGGSEPANTVTDARLMAFALDGGETSLVFVNGRRRGAVATFPFALQGARYAAIEALGKDLGEATIAVDRSGGVKYSLFDLWMSEALKRLPRDGRGGFAVGSTVSAGRASVSTVRSSRAFAMARLLGPASRVRSADEPFEKLSAPERGAAVSRYAAEHCYESRGGLTIHEGTVRGSASLWLLGDPNEAPSDVDASEWYARRLASGSEGAAIALARVASKNPEGLDDALAAQAPHFYSGATYASIAAAGGPNALAGALLIANPAHARTVRRFEDALAEIARANRGEASLRKQAALKLTESWFSSLDQRTLSAGELVRYVNAAPGDVIWLQEFRLRVLEKAVRLAALARDHAAYLEALASKALSNADGSGALASPELVDEISEAFGPILESVPQHQRSDFIAMALKRISAQFGASGFTSALKRIRNSIDTPDELLAVDEVAREYAVFDGFEQAFYEASLAFFEGEHRPTGAEALRLLGRLRLLPERRRYLAQTAQRSRASFRPMCAAYGVTRIDSSGF